MLSRLATEAPRMHDGLFMRVKELAAKHRHVLARFGRFPERNAVLGRESTEEEQQYLAK